MSGSGGESVFRQANGKPVHTPGNERVVIKLSLPQNYFLNKMLPAAGSLGKEDEEKLKNKDLYIKFKKVGMSDAEYYAITEVRIPEPIHHRYIIGHMVKS